MTIISAGMGKLIATIGRRMRAIAVGHAAKLNGIKQTAQDLNFLDPERYGLPNGRAAVATECVNEPDASAEHAEATQTCLPIGPCCC